MDTTEARRILTAEFQRQGRTIVTTDDVDHYTRKMLDVVPSVEELVEEYWDGQDDGQDDSVDTINRAALVWMELV
jgi:hypothetical protein